MAVAIEPLKALYGFSRGTQATLSVAQPLLAALIAYSDPPPARLALATLAAFAGFFAVFAANDLLDARLDRKRFASAHAVRAYEGRDVDSAGARHPLAQGRLSFALGLAWVLGLSALALVVTAMLSWVCTALFLAAAALEVAYCLLATVTPYKCVLSGVMVAVGASAGWFAVTGTVDPVLLGLFAMWMAAWEIGGRNIPNDLADVDEDVHLGIRTLPVVHGARAAAAVACGLMLTAAAASCVLAYAARDSFGVVGLAGTVIAGSLTLVVPAARLLRRPLPPVALAAFNRATFHPVLVLAAFAAALALR